MCKRSIICMGNSYKNGGRCLAGIEVEKTFGVYSIVTNRDGSPKWLRPVMINDCLGIPEHLVGTFGLFDILDVDVIGIAPTGAQNENVYFRSIVKIGHYNGGLNSLCDNSHSLIFGNKGKAVAADDFCDVGYSLMIIKPQDLYIESQDGGGYEKFRMQFTYKGIRYDFPLTDPVYIRKLRNRTCSRGDRSGDEVFLTLSLGVCFNEWHYKLVAGVFDMAS